MKTDFANLKRYASVNEKLHNVNNGGNRIVFFGDSITEFWTPRNSTLFQNPNHINRGISGQTTSQMVKRFQQDVVELHPKLVVILAGINDIAENTGPITTEAIFQNIITMVESAIANAIEVILCSVLPSNTISWKTTIAPSDKIIQLNQMIQTYAEATKIPYIDYYHSMVDNNKGLAKKYSDDGVHPNSEGYKIMERLISEK
jgi:lysophospholipase L1-like esterase